MFTVKAVTAAAFMFTTAFAGSAFAETSKVGPAGEQTQAAIPTDAVFQAPAFQAPAPQAADRTELLREHRIADETQQAATAGDVSASGIFWGGIFVVVLIFAASGV